MVRLTDRLLAGSFILALMAHAYLGSFSRYMADDYTTARIVQSQGLLSAQVHWYLRWTGRFSFTFVASLLGLVGPATTRFIPGLLLILWFGGTACAIRQTKTSWTRAVLVAGLIIFATVETAPNLVQSLYWQTGAVIYIAPLVLLSLYVALLISQRGSLWFNLCCGGVLTFVAGGFSDAYVVLQSCALVLAILATEIMAPSRVKQKVRGLLLAGLLGGLVSLTIVAIAPGNSVRQSYFPNHLGVLEILRLSTLYSLGFVAKLILSHPVVVSILVGLPFITAVRDSGMPLWNRRLCIHLIVLIPLAVLVLSACCIAPSFYGMSLMLPERARIFLSLIFVCGTVIWSHAAGEFLLGKLHLVSHNVMRIGSTLLLILITACPLVSFVSTLALREQARGYATDWDRQDVELRTAKRDGVNDVEVQQIGDFQSRIGKGASDLHLRTDPAFWINVETAKYYGLSSVRAKDDVAVLR